MPERRPVRVVPPFRSSLFHFKHPRVAAIVSPGVGARRIGPRRNWCVWWCLVVLASRAVGFTHHPARVPAGYGCCRIPVEAGIHELEIVTWAPEGGFMERLAGTCDWTGSWLWLVQTLTNGTRCLLVLCSQVAWGSAPVGAPRPGDRRARGQMRTPRCLARVRPCGGAGAGERV